MNMWREEFQEVLRASAAGEGRAGVSNRARVGGVTALAEQVQVNCVAGSHRFPTYWMLPKELRFLELPLVLKIPK